ncbi:MAG TPA: FAD binding domain-containing protein, partial [Nitrososphaerales archaeon]|nr:FAD binding domain-containing protein [Nitrososphaerales archaeon]
DIKKINDLNSINFSRSRGARLGAAVTLTRILSDQDLIDNFSGLVQAARSVATGQIRNMGTLGGNLCQRPWCWYFRHPAFDCFKKGGKQCYAITGDNSTYFSIYDIGTCVMAHPSDTAPALISLDAKVKIASVRGEREINLSDFFLGPKYVQDNVLETDELLVSVNVPKQSSTRRSVYLKHRIRNNWDFALVSVAASGNVDSQGNIEAINLVLGAVAPHPVLVNDVKSVLIGRKLDQESMLVVNKLLSEKAKPLRMNKYKVRIVRALVRRALESIFL